ncbi:hypothetical protein [Streptomyces fradiae]|uniref:hypothetical protein n=1 Tax=Streptomyces fradiae TaxID=1906 RepID=UPI0033D95B83
MRARTGTIQTWSRRSVLGAGLYSAALLVPAFHELAGRAEAVRAGRTVRIGDGDVATVRRMTDKVAEILDEIGAGHARPMAAAFLANTVGPYLKASGPERVRREMRAAAADLVYLTGWMAMYEDRQALGQRYYVKALRLAGEAEDHITYCRTLRGTSLQASHLGYGPKALELADGAAAAAPSAGPRLLNYSIDNFGDSGDQTGRDHLYGLDRYRLADFGRSESGAFLRALASDADAYETVSAAQQLYGTSMMAAAGDATDAQTIGKHSAYMHGALDGARSEAIGKEFADDAARRNLELQKQAAWREYVTSAVVGAGVGMGTALVTGTGVGAILIPVAIETVGGAVETHVQTQMMDWLEANKYSNSAEAVASLDDAREAGEKRAMIPLLGWATSEGFSKQEVTDLRDGAESKYGASRDFSDTDDGRGH